MIEGWKFTCSYVWLAAEIARLDAWRGRKQRGDIQKKKVKKYELIFSYSIMMNLLGDMSFYGGRLLLLLHCLGGRWCGTTSV
jgi:hypothetical protein